MKTFLWSMMLLCTTQCFSQTNSSAKDTLIWSNGTVYTGAVIKEGKGEVQFKTEDGQIHRIAASSIAQLKLVNPPVDNQLPPAMKAETKAAAEKPANAAEDESAVNWSNPNLSKRAVLKHKTGLGLTITGTTMMVGGIAMLIGGIANNGQTTTVNNGYSTQTNVNVGAVGVVGVLSLLVGLPITIVGAVKLAKAKKMARAETIYLR